MKHRLSLNFNKWSNDFKSGVIWYEKFSFYANDYPIFAYRVYNWMHSGAESRSIAIAILCFQLNLWDEQ